MTYDNTKVKGGCAEVEALRFFMGKGYTASLPFGENAPYDLVVESPAKRLYRIQVRWSTWRGNTLHVRLRVVSKNYSRTIDQSRVDAFVVWDGNDIFVIPSSETASYTSEMTLRREAPKNSQQKGIRLASLFKEAVHFVP